MVFLLCYYLHRYSHPIHLFFELTLSSGLHVMNIKNGLSLVPVLCLIIAAGVLYAKPVILTIVFHPLSIPVLDGKSSPGSDIVIHYHERPPYYVTGPLGVYGLVCDPVKRAFNDAGITYRWEKTPAARQLDILKFNGQNTCIIGWFKTPERETFALYSRYIYQDRPTIALARSGNERMVSGRALADTLKNEELVLLRKEGYSYGSFVDDMISRYNPVQEVTTAGNIGMLKMIHDRQADYFFISGEEAVELVRTSGLLPDDFTFIRFTDVPKGNRRYLLFNRKVDPYIIEKFDRAMEHQQDNETDEEEYRGMMP